MGESFLGAVTRFAFKGIVLRTDGMQIVAASVMPAIFRALGWPMPESAQVASLAYIGYAIAAFVILRFLTAPYFIWKEDKALIAGLEQALASPKQRERQIIAERLADERFRLSEEVTRIRSVMISKSTSTDEKRRAFYGSEVMADKFWNDPLFEEAWEDFHEAANRIFQRWLALEASRDEEANRVGFMEAHLFGIDRYRINRRASRLINYLLYDIKPGPLEESDLDSPKQVLDPRTLQ